MPTLAQTAGYMRDPILFLKNARKRYGEPFTLSLLGFGTIVVISEPKLLQELTNGPPSIFMAGEANAPLAPVMGRHSLPLLDGPRHLEQRRLLLPPLHGEHLQNYADIMATIAKREIDSWRDTSAFPLLPRMLRLSLEIILQVVFGLSKDRRLEQMRALIPRFLTRGQQVVFWGLMSQHEIWPWRPRIRFLSVKNDLDRLIYGLIADRRAAPDLERREDVLSMLCRARHEDGTLMAEEEIRDELVSLIMAGHDTTGLALSWTMELLLRNPRALQCLQDELASNSSEKYLDAVIQETQRMRPSVPLIARMLDQPYEFNGQRLPADTVVAGGVALVHHRDDIYPNPEAFRPERFIDDSVESSSESYAWLPFGGGIRRCVGASFAQLELRQVLPLLVNAGLQPVSKRPEHMVAAGIILKPLRGVRVRLTSMPKLDRAAVR
jgi:cytochrome P450 family 135